MYDAGKVYLASDFHLGVDAALTSRERERQLVRWLDHCAQDASAVYLVGDLFDFWFEYRRVVPRGYVRLLGKLAELRDAGLPIHCFVGNHDMWLTSYFPDELGIPVHRNPVLHELQGRQCLIGHGDGLGPGDYGYKRMKRVFANPGCQWLFARLHPNLALGIADYFSGRSRRSTGDDDLYLGPEREWLIQYAEEKLHQQPDIDYFIFGHRHLPIDYLLHNGQSRYLNLGQWLTQCSYVVLEDGTARHEFFERAPGMVYGQ